MVLDLSIGTSSDQLRDSVPLIFIFFICLHHKDKHALLDTPGTLVKQWIKLIGPSFTALLSVTIWDESGK